MLIRGGVYVTGKFGQDETVVQRLLAELLALGYESTYDWTLNPVAKPFNERPAEAAAAAAAMIDGVIKAELVIVLVGPGLWGGLVEFGANIGAGVVAAMLGHEKKIYVVGEKEWVEKSIFAFHPLVTRCTSCDEVLAAIKCSLGL